MTPLAEQDIEAIGDYIASDNPARALSFIEELRERCLRIALSPAGYRQRPELGDGIRSCTHGNYVIFFIANSGETTVVRVLHGARDIPVQFAADDSP